MKNKEKIVINAYLKAKENLSINGLNASYLDTLLHKAFIDEDRFSLRELELINEEKEIFHHENGKYFIKLFAKSVDKYILLKGSILKPESQSNKRNKETNNYYSKLDNLRINELDNGNIKRQNDNSYIVVNDIEFTSPYTLYDFSFYSSAHRMSILTSLKTGKNLDQTFGQ